MVVPNCKVALFLTHRLEQKMKSFQTQPLVNNNPSALYPLAQEQCHQMLQYNGTC